MLNFKNINVLCAGLSCIDVIRNNNEDFVSLGGTAANVASFMSVLGLHTSFLQADYRCANAAWFFDQFLERGINIIKFNQNSIAVPTIIEELNNGQHKFVTKCPICNKKTNDIKLPTIKNIAKYVKYLDLNLFYYDRISEGIKHIAFQNRNGWNMYEPNSIRVYNTFLKNAETANIIKLSQESIPEKYIEKMRIDLAASNVQILIVSLGADGLKFSYRQNKNLSNWIFLHEYKPPKLVDTSGAGDWLTASFLYMFLQNYPYYSESISDKIIMNCLIQSQKVASYSCSFIGAQNILKDKHGIEQINKVLNSHISILQSNNFINKGCRYCKR